MWGVWPPREYLDEPDGWESAVWSQVFRWLWGQQPRTSALPGDRIPACCQTWYHHSRWSWWVDGTGVQKVCEVSSNEWKYHFWLHGQRICFHTANDIVSLNDVWIVQWCVKQHWQSPSTQYKQRATTTSSSFILIVTTCLYVQMSILMMRTTWYWIPSYRSTWLTLASTWWPWRRQVPFF